MVQHYSHEIDEKTFYCMKCGRSLYDLQTNAKWVGNELHPLCVETPKVIAISHVVREHRV